jgi:hypothetical protein
MIVQRRARRLGTAERLHRVLQRIDLKEIDGDWGRRVKVYARLRSIVEGVGLDDALLKRWWMDRTRSSSEIPTIVEELLEWVPFFRRPDRAIVEHLHSISISDSHSWMAKHKAGRELMRIAENLE